MIDKLISGSGGGAEGRRAAFGVLNSLGVQMGREELKALDEGASPERLAEIRQQRNKGAEKAKQVAGDPEALARAAMRSVPDALSKQARQTNAQIKNGDKMVSSLKDLEDVAQKFTVIVTDMLMPILNFLGAGTKEIADKVEKFKKDLNEPIEVGPRE